MTHHKYTLKAKRNSGRDKGSNWKHGKFFLWELIEEISPSFSGRIIRDRQIYQPLWHGGIGLESNTFLHHKTANGDFKWKEMMTIFIKKNNILLTLSVEAVLKELYWQQGVNRAPSFASKPRVKKKPNVKVNAKQKKKKVKITDSSITALLKNLALCSYFSSHGHFLTPFSKEEESYSYQTSGCREQGCVVHTYGNCSLPAPQHCLFSYLQAQQPKKYWVSPQY